MIRAVFLDIDDTLLSFTGFVRQVMREGFSELGIGTYTDDMFDVFRQVNGGLWRQIERGELTLPELELVRWNAVFEALGLSYDGVAFERHFRRKLFSNAILEQHALELLRALDGRYVLCVASNGPYEQQVNRLRVAGMLPYFGACFVSERLGAQKPSALFFDRAFGELRAGGLADLTPDEAMIVGDSLTSDMAGGAGYGLRTCLYCPAGAPAELPEGVDHVVTDLLQVEDVLRSYQ